MPWRTCRPMDERLRFVARLLEGEKMAPPCRGVETRIVLDAECRAESGIDPSVVKAVVRL